MKRIHVGLKVSDIEKAVIFYTRLFGMKPSLLRSDYAKWMLDDPLLNFSVDIHGEGPVGSAHFGVQVNGNECEYTIVYELNVGEGDLGKVIGKKGKNVNSIRTLLSASNAIDGGKRAILEIIE